MKYQIKLLLIASLSLSSAAHAALIDLSAGSTISLRTVNSSSVDLRRKNATINWQAFNVEDLHAGQFIQSGSKLSLTRLNPIRQDLNRIPGQIVINGNNPKLVLTGAGQLGSISGISMVSLNQSSSVPLPATGWLFVTGLLGLLGRSRALRRV